MKFCSLGSGSLGNSYILAHGEQVIVIDCGFNISEFQKRIKKLQIDPLSITAMLLTHEHEDHSRSIFSIASKYNLPIYLTHGTYKMCQKKINKNKVNEFIFINFLEVFKIGNIKITPIPVPHDAREPVQFKFEYNDKKIAIISDLGFGNQMLIDQIKNVDALILESNHDDNLLAKSKYPKSLKDRISGKYGHLSNTESAKILDLINTKNLLWLGASHLSKENNTSDLVKNSWRKVLKNNSIGINIIEQDNVTNWVTI